MANKIIARADAVLEFGNNGRDIYAYSQKLWLVLKYMNSHSGRDELFKTGYAGVERLNTLLGEYRRIQAIGILPIAEESEARPGI
jgi:hypothetical protein